MGEVAGWAGQVFNGPMTMSQGTIAVLGDLQKRRVRGVDRGSTMVDGDAVPRRWE